MTQPSSPNFRNTMPKNHKRRGISGAETEKFPKSAKLATAVRTFVFSPIFNVIALVFLLLLVFGGLRMFTARKTEAQVKFVEHEQFESSEKENSENQRIPAPDIFKGEIYGTSIRLRETGALGMAVSLAVFEDTSRQGSAPANLGNIWKIVSESSLMPPGLEFQNGALVSATSTFVIRFQPQPMRFEILSLPKKNIESPAIMMRFPLASLDGRTITYFQSGNVTRFDIPAPFASIENVVSAGWTIEQWRGELLPSGVNQMKLLEDEKKLLNESDLNR